MFSIDETTVDLTAWHTSGTTQGSFPKFFDPRLAESVDVRLTDTARRPYYLVGGEKGFPNKFGDMTGRTEVN